MTGKRAGKSSGKSASNHADASDQAPPAPGIAHGVDAAAPTTPPASPSTLNQGQRKAVDHTGGPLIVLAGPGTGKTHVITSRVARLVEQGADPSSILALTFSVKAAAEMRRRFAVAIGPRRAEQICATTFHSFGNRIMARFGDLIGLRRERTIMDGAQQIRLLRSLIRRHGLFEHMAARGREQAAEPMKAFIGACRNAARSPRDAMLYAETMLRRAQQNPDGLTGDALVAAHQEAIEFDQRARLFAAYDDECFERGLLTFDDFLTTPLRIFAQHPFAASIVRDELRHVLVDEFQDVNRAQVELLRHIAPPKLPSGARPDLCVVGDDDQAIYAWRGAHSKAFAEFEKAWGAAQRAPLTENYRSGRAIITAANAVISRCGTRFDPDKIIEQARAPRDGAPGNGVVEGVILDDDKHAGIAIVAMIRRAREMDPSLAFSKFGVLCRGNSAVSSVVAALEMHGVPVAVRERPSPLDDQAVQDLLAWLRLLADPTGPAAGACVRRLLLRPPFFVPMDRVTRWVKSYETEQSWNGEDARPTLLSWLVARSKDDPALDRFLILAEELRRFAAQNTGALTVRRVIARAELAYAEPEMSSAARARRVSALAAAIRWAESRQPHFDPPGDVAALMSYYDDLPPGEDEFAAPGDERLDGAAEQESSDLDAVSVMTAHKAKGLEFDTVFIVKCRPNGFPDKKRDEEDPAPAEFLGYVRDGHEDEERRLFYVACTRAERRLVMLAKAKKKKGEATDFFIELEQETPGLSMSVLDGTQIIEGAGLSPDSAGEVDDAEAAEARRQKLLAREAALVRQSAFAALHDASDARLNDAALSGVQHRLASAAEALRAIDLLRTTGALPPMLPAAHEPRLRELASQLERGAPAAGPVGLKPPLKLSYSAIAAYQKCGRCYFLSQFHGVREATGENVSLGAFVHEALRRFTDECRRAEEDGRFPPGHERLLELAQIVCREQWPPSLPFDREILDQMRAQLTNFHERFDAHSANVLAFETAVRFRYPCPRDAGRWHTFTAKFDRLDQPLGAGVRLVDYKTGHNAAKFLEPKRDDLQMSIYAMALHVYFKMSDGDRARRPDGEELPLLGAEIQPPPGVAEYWLLSTGQRGSIAFDQLRLDKARKTIDEAIMGMLRGEWPRGHTQDGPCPGCAWVGDDWTPERPPESPAQEMFENDAE
jgi:superfamily I DNA/RNA helicase